MQLAQLLDVKTICLNLKSQTKNELIDELVQVLDKAGKLVNKSKFREAILKREADFSTGLENGVAVPHARSEAVRFPAVVIGISKNGVDYGALDNKPSKIFFMIAETEELEEEHLAILSSITHHMKDAEELEAILSATTADELLHLFDEDKTTEEGEIVSSLYPKVLAVTACPTGIAHTYMAATALEDKAREMKIPIKVETNGAIGVKNRLTAEEIKNADVIIVAADTLVDMGRFVGKKVIQTSVREGIHSPNTLLAQVGEGGGELYTLGKENQRLESSKGEKSGIYKHLMNGVSNMLPFVVGGGLLMALAMAFGINAHDPNSPDFSPVAKLLMELGGNNGAFGLMVPVLAGFIGMSIADRPGFMPAMVGGFMSIHLGGGFLGGIIAGLLAGYVVQLIKRISYRIPEQFRGIQTVLIYPVIGLLIAGTLMYFLLLPISAVNVWLVVWLKNLGVVNLVAMGFLLGGLMAVDMGGPVNKAAFTFGIAAIEAGNYFPHAAVMAGGMVPPIALSLATVVFSNRFSKSELKAGKSSFVLGASFITEGAIPFAAADPIRVIPACIAGSALAGSLSMVFGCQLMVPHGGVFVVPLMQEPLSFLVSILLGSALTAIILGVAKKPIY